jgi:hypothetical protein
MTSAHRHGGTRLWTTLAVSVGFALVLVAAGPAAAQDGVQFSGDCFSTYVNKQVGQNEQWAITWEIDGDATGNVFMLDGSAPAQIECELLDGDEFNQVFDCFGSSACAGPPCGGGQWTLIASEISIPTTFFLPPGIDPNDPEDSCEDR